tara:strand:+ start:514 stop:1239 length:726 start_codon:yes stop_codon:yes gene_type:complete
VNHNNKKIKIPADIVSINCLSPHESLKALDYSTKNLTFNNSILFTSENVKSDIHKIIKIEKFNNLEDYSDFTLSLNSYISSNHVLIIQDDGHVVNPYQWKEEFLNYDYIGAPWPTENKWRKRWAKDGYQNAYDNVLNNRVGNGGFSLRSKKFLNYSSKFKTCNGIAEDTFLCLVNYEEAIKDEIKFAPFELAMQFSYEVPLKGRKLNKEDKSQELNTDNHFGWHGKRFLNSKELLNLKNEV